MLRAQWIGGIGAIRAIGAIAAAVAIAVPASGQAVPAKAELAPSVRMALQSAAVSDAERAALRLRHGTWDDGDLLTPADRARAALATWDLDADALGDPAAPAALRAEALVRAGRPADALPLLDGASDARGLLVRALALDALGRNAEAVEAARRAKAAGEQDDAARDARMDAIEATALLARLEGRPARDWQAMLDALAKLRDADQLDPRPRLLEGRLLVEKDRFEDGVAALREALARDLRCGEAIYLLGRVAVQTFDFDGARQASALLLAIDRDHPLAPLLDAEASLQSRDAETATKVLDVLLARFPGHRQAMALRSAADGMTFDMETMRSRLGDLDALMPGSPVGPFEAGRFLALGRQYDEAAELLGEAARRAPGWSAPVAELGLLEMQSGRDGEAMTALRRAVELDPYDQRARHSLTLVEMLADWKRFEGTHFVVRCKPGIDEALAAWMPQALDAMQGDVTAWLGHVPARKTVIELHPDHKSLAVRITGMPWIHTIAASTGPLIALEAPREGAPQLHLGTFDWLEVLRHEFVHTVTLEQTRNRIPHWFTEALATRLETKPRSWETVQMLAQAFESDSLFDLDAINWAFVRPKKKTDRAQAYAQGAWMAEFIEKEWGRDAVLRLLAEYREGRPEARAFAEVLGVDRAAFMSRFRAHAERDLKSWGMLAEPSMASIVDAIRAETGAAEGTVEIDDARLDALLAKHPAHPDLLELWLRRRLKGDATPDAAVAARLAAYSEARPADPWPHRVLAKARLADGDQAAAVPHLEALDARADNDANFALELARIERARKNLPRALEHATKAARIMAYDPATREFVAAIAVEAGDLDAARMHIEALVRLEPSVAKHAQRLARIDEMIAKRPKP
jgi:tetratricopeptide (TPR) repeat protein